MRGHSSRIGFSRSFTSCIFKGRSLAQVEMVQLSYAMCFTLKHKQEDDRRKDLANRDEIQLMHQGENIHTNRYMDILYIYYMYKSTVIKEIM